MVEVCISFCSLIIHTGCESDWWRLHLHGLLLPWKETATKWKKIQGCTSGGVCVPCIYTQSSWELPQVTQVLLYLCYIFWALINSFVCWSYRINLFSDQKHTFSVVLEQDEQKASMHKDQDYECLNCLRKTILITHSNPDGYNIHVCVCACVHAHTHSQGSH